MSKDQKRISNIQVRLNKYHLAVGTLFHLKKYILTCKTFLVFLRNALTATICNRLDQVTSAPSWTVDVPRWASTVTPQSHKETYRGYFNVY